MCTPVNVWSLFSRHVFAYFVHDYASSVYNWSSATYAYRVNVYEIKP